MDDVGILQDPIGHVQDLSRDGTADYRSSALDTWCRRQQRVWPSLFCLRVPGRPVSQNVSTQVQAVSHRDGTYSVTIAGRCVAICDGCGSLVSVDVGVAESPLLDSVASCRVCGFVSALDPVLRRSLRLACKSAGLRLSRDVAYAIISEAQGPPDLCADSRKSELRTFAGCVQRRQRALQDLLDLIGVGPGMCVVSLPRSEPMLSRECVEEGAWLLNLFVAAQGDIGSHPPAASAESLDQLALSFTAAIERKEAAREDAECAHCKDMIDSSRSLLSMVIASAKVVSAVGMSDTAEKRQSALKGFYRGREDMGAACSFVRMHLSRCQLCLSPAVGD